MKKTALLDWLKAACRENALEWLIDQVEIV
jgi:hypothetical protein